MYVEYNGKTQTRKYRTSFFLYHDTSSLCYMASGRRGGCRMSLAETVFVCHGGEVGRANDQRLIVVYVELLALN